MHDKLNSIYFVYYIVPLSLLLTCIQYNMHVVCKVINNSNCLILDR